MKVKYGLLLKTNVHQADEVRRTRDAKQKTKCRKILGYEQKGGYGPEGIKGN